jgi:hypothetical protein
MSSSGSSSPAPSQFFILVWAAGRETPLYACPSHPAAELQLHTTPAIHAVALYRYFTSLALLTSGTAGAGRVTEGSETGVILTSSVVPSGCREGRDTTTAAPQLHPCVFGTTALFHVAVIAAATLAETRPMTMTAEWLRWIAQGLLASLEPAAWQASPDVIHASPSSSPPPLRHARRRLAMPPPTSAADLAAQLTRFWEAAEALTAATSAAMEGYGVSEVLAEGDHGALSLWALLEAFSAASSMQSGSAVAPVAIAIKAYLDRWWLPFVAPVAHNGTSLQLAGYFSIRECASAVGGGKTSEDFPQHPPSAIPALLSLSGATEALTLLARFCQHHHNQPHALPDMNDGDRSFLFAMQLSTTTALVAVDTGVVTAAAQRVFQVAVVRNGSGLHRIHRAEKPGCFTPVVVRRVDAGDVFRKGEASLWNEAVLSSVG